MSQTFVLFPLLSKWVIQECVFDTSSGLKEKSVGDDAQPFQLVSEIIVSDADPDSIHM